MMLPPPCFTLDVASCGWKFTVVFIFGRTKKKVPSSSFPTLFLVIMTVFNVPLFCTSCWLVPLYNYIICHPLLLLHLWKEIRKAETLFSLFWSNRWQTNQRRTLKWNQKVLSLSFRLRPGAVLQTGWWKLLLHFRLQSIRFSVESQNICQIKGGNNINV